MARQNEASGQIMVEICGKEVELCFNLGAIAHLEQAWKCPSLEDVFRRLATIKGASDLLVVLEALAGDQLTRKEIAALTPKDFESLLKGIQRTLENSFPETNEGNARRASA